MKQIGTILTVFGGQYNRIVVVSVPNDGTEPPNDILVLNEDDKTSADTIFQLIGELAIGTGSQADEFLKENQIDHAEMGLRIVARYTQKLTESGLSMETFAGGVANRLGFKLDNSHPYVITELDNWLIEESMPVDEQITPLLKVYQDEGYTHVKAEIFFGKENPRTHGSSKVVPHFPEDDEIVSTHEEFLEFIRVNLKRSFMFTLSKK